MELLWIGNPRDGKIFFVASSGTPYELVAPNGVGCSACHGDWSLFAHEICRHAPSVTARKHWNLRATPGYRATGFSVLPHEGGPFVKPTRV